METTRVAGGPQLKVEDLRDRAQHFLNLQTSNSRISKQDAEQLNRLITDQTKELSDLFKNAGAEDVFSKIFKRGRMLNYALNDATYQKFSESYREVLYAKGAQKDLAQLQLAQIVLQTAASMEGGLTKENLERAYNQIMQNHPQFFRNGMFFITEDKLQEWTQVVQNLLRQTMPSEGAQGTSGGQGNNPQANNPTTPAGEVQQRQPDTQTEIGVVSSGYAIPQITVNGPQTGDAGGSQ